MAEKNNKMLELINVSATETMGSQDLMMCINKRQMLSASLMKQIDQKYIPFYTFVQQPTAMLKPFNAMGSDGPVNISIPEIPFTTNSVKERQQDGDENALAITLYSSAAEGLDTKFCMNNESLIVESHGGAGSQLTRALQVQCSYSERKKNWIIRRLARSKGNRWDSYYVHLQTDEQFRSLLAVHNFIVHGLLPKRRKSKKGEAHNNTMASPSQFVRGDKLLNRIPVGHYNHTTREIHRNEEPKADGDGGSIGSGSKRKRGDETSVQQGEELSNASYGASQLIFTLYDFEPIN